MLVKIFKAQKAFSGVKYNTGKIDRNKGELMKVANFGPLQTFGHLKPQDYINYLGVLAALNKNVRLPQFHAVISAKGKSYDKITLTAIAEAWLKEMGYGDQPYLVVFHKDTANNHVHMVSARVDRMGNKINSAYEYLRAQKSINKVLGYDFAMEYRFSTRAQFMMVLESKGYPGTDPDEAKIQEKISRYVPDKKRTAALSQLFRQYKNQPGFRDLMKEKYGIDLIFHQAPGKQPYGYSIIDHYEKQVFKGSEVMALKELISSFETDPVEIAVENTSDEYTPSVQIRSIAIADDVDDQQIHGMRRRRQKKARTNTR
ncbi:relaxase/mobilization nuclease domain-containing protein [Mucilaginibacter sp. L3T2-6]|uniref:relaxase/mobilization nuclease domain-containing protein n=1 Tax=Mucilaginibacter sp. L3T2-6 TaxID=3062491 RepID=UPI002675AAA5|nr:relaxase/mobilization nuclease domain-containing protein [Mucilaginibacter sp. L3T2-6]MDO3643514.1 relaxase/mobilization nuclease domain-containing protein [Mucilaginibacter sp. L3T2-6]MDV6215965.1 relaxase/mobilization nuclease domain-containing protein [Mucilaginibacter sp. L3T2-6]